MKRLCLLLLVCCMMVCVACAGDAPQGTDTPMGNVTPSPDSTKNPVTALLVAYYDRKDTVLMGLSICLESYVYQGGKDYSELVASATTNLYEADALFAELLVSANQMQYVEQNRWAVEDDTYHGQTTLENAIYHMTCETADWVDNQGETRTLSQTLDIAQDGGKMEAHAYSLVGESGKTLELWMQCKPHGMGYAAQYYYAYDEVGNYICIRYLFDENGMEYAIWPDADMPQTLDAVTVDDTFFQDATTWVKYDGEKVTIKNGMDVVIVRGDAS